MFFRNFINRKVKTRFETRIRRKVPYLMNNFKTVVPRYLVTKYDKGEDIYFDKAPLPYLYYKNEIILMPKNLDTLFAYWEVREDDFNEMKEKYNIFDTVTILLYKNDNLFRKITGLNRVGSYYISNIKANRIYKAKLGFENSNGDFFEIVESKKAVSPTGKISNKRADIWGIPYNLNGSIKMNFYSKDNLPDNHILKQEITDRELIIGNELEIFKGSYYKFDKNGNLIFVGSSNNTLGASENIK